MRCQDCDDDTAVVYTAPPDAAGTFCRRHARWLPVAPMRPGNCRNCGTGNSAAFWVRRDDGVRTVRCYCAQHAPPRTPGGTV